MAASVALTQSTGRTSASLILAGIVSVTPSSSLGKVAHEESESDPHEEAHVTKRAGALTALAVVTVIALVLVWWSRPQEDPVVDHRAGDGAGPLVPGGPDGAYTMVGPGVIPWWGSIGALRMCLEGDAESARITGHRVVTGEGAEPLDVKIMVRHVTPEDVGGKEAVDDFVMSDYGSLPDFDEPYAQPPMYRRGSFVPFDGLVITRRCDDLLHPGGGVKVPIHEMVVSVQSDERGGVIDHLEIDYESGGQAYRVRSEYTMKFCGTAVDEDVCEGQE